MQDRLLDDSRHLESFAEHGLGQLTRHYGTTPLDAHAGRELLRERQEWLSTQGAGIPAIVHEETLTGVMAWGAAAFPAPLAWGATWSPELIRELGERVGADMASLGIHQGLAPVLDVIRDVRWGRVEECIAEDPLLVGALGSSYVAGLEAQGRVATLKHFAGYSASRGGRNIAPVSLGRRELEEVFLPPFERAIREGGARSVMNSYCEIDGVPSVADPWLFTDMLRHRWGFTGTVVADYFAIDFLTVNHRVAESAQQAAALALEAGIDIELPTGKAYLAPLAEAVRSGAVDMSLVDRATLRVLEQKAQLGLLGPLEGRASNPELVSSAPLELNGPQHDDLARRLAEASIVLLAGPESLPLGATVGEHPTRIAVVGPVAVSRESMLGCYSFVNHVLARHPEQPWKLHVPTVAEALVSEFADAEIVVERGCGVAEGLLGDAPESPADIDAGIAAAVAAAQEATLTILVLGDRSGMFGRGTSGEGCDVVTAELPGHQRRLAEAILATGTPTALVVVSGRPYVLDGLVEHAIVSVQAFLPGQHGAAAIAGVLSGRVAPSGRLPVSIPARSNPHPSSYLRPFLGGPTGASSADPTPRFPFGFGLTTTHFEVELISAPSGDHAVDAPLELDLLVRNAGQRAGVEVLQVYAAGRVCSVTRPERELIAFARVAVDPGAERRFRLSIPPHALSFIDRTAERVIEPGPLRLEIAADALAIPHATAAVRLTGKRTVMTSDDYAHALWSESL